MVSLELHDLLTFDDATDADDRSRLDGDRPVRRRHAARSLESRRPRPRARWPDRCTSRSTSGSRTAVDSAAGRPMPPPRCVGGGGTLRRRTRSCRGSGRRHPVLSGRRPGAGARHRRDRRATSVRAAVDPADHPTAAREHAGRLPGVGRTRSGDPHRDTATTWRRRRSSSNRGWRVGATTSPNRSGWHPRSPAAGRRGSSRATSGHRTRVIARGRTRCTRRAAARRSCGRRRSMPYAPPAPELDQELVQRGRRGDERRDERCYLRRWWRVRRSIFLCFFFRMRLRRFLINEPIRVATLSVVATVATRRYRGALDRPGSSNGKTAVFGAENRGSIPLPGAHECFSDRPRGR